MDTIKKNIKYVRKKINIFSNIYNRESKQISLLAVSKSQNIINIQKAIALGQYIFGENYVNEGIKKIVWFRNNVYSYANLKWHFIGNIQSNKSKLIANYFDWCHSIDSIRIANKLNNNLSYLNKKLHVLIQINISNNINRKGINNYNDIFLLAKHIIYKCPNLKLHGLMGISFCRNRFINKLIEFNKIFFIFKKLQLFYSKLDTLSIGMTNDIEPAIAFGSTLLRIGTGIFGNRSNNLV